ncbi:MAG: efflux RND transporter periplasmic adaptor subunit [Vicingaceae bacterium]
MKKFQIFPLLFSLLFACKSEQASEENKKSIQAATLVEVVLAQDKEVKEVVKTTGSLKANESTELSTEIGGIVDKINFEEGSFIKKGSLLLTLNNDDLAAEVKEAKASKELAEKQYRRNQQLKKAKGISQEVLDQSETNFEEKSATLNRLEAKVAETKVYAPFDGIIGLRSVSQGDYLASNNSFASLVDITPIKIEFSLPEKYSSKLKQGDSISFTSSVLSKTKQALVYAVEPQIEETSRTIRAKARYHNQDQALLPGEFVSVSYEVENFENSIMIPNQAIIPELDGKKVFVVKNGKVASQKIVTGIRMADQTQVLEGLNDGDSVVSSGLLQIRDGIPVRIRMDESYLSEKESAE